MHPATAALLRHFVYLHLPLELQEVSRPFSELAHRVVKLGDDPEVSACLRKLLEAKDCAVRAAVVNLNRPEPHGPDGA